MSKVIGFRATEKEQQEIEAAIVAHQCKDLKSLVFSLLTANPVVTPVGETSLVIEFPTSNDKQRFSALCRVNKAEPYVFINRLIKEVKNNTISTNIKL